MTRRLQKILLIEDDPNDELLTVRTFRANRIANEVHVARDGQEGLDYLLARGAHANRDPRDLPAMVFLDLKLPKADGFEVLAQIRNHPATRLIPVVVLTSSKDQVDRSRGYALGANCYIQKPVDFLQFSELVRQLGLYWIVSSEPMTG